MNWAAPFLSSAFDFCLHLLCQFHWHHTYLEKNHIYIKIPVQVTTTCTLNVGTLCSVEECISSSCFTISVNICKHGMRNEKLLHNPHSPLLYYMESLLHYMWSKWTDEQTVCKFLLFNYPCDWYIIKYKCLPEHVCFFFIFSVVCVPLLVTFLLSSLQAEIFFIHVQCEKLKFGVW